MGSFTHVVAKGEAAPFAMLTLPETKTVVAAGELRGRGLNVIAATLEGVLTARVCAVVAPGREEAWARTLETDVVELFKRRYLQREQALFLVQATGEEDSPAMGGVARDYRPAARAPISS
jgi:hypothetical protein